MASICNNCGKSASVGHSQQHRRGVAGKRWKNRVTATKRLFKPNLHPYTISESGTSRRAVLCAKCIKRIKKDAKSEALSA